jgi:S1-C subfamily serine protease
MDAPVTVSHAAAPSVLHLRSAIPADHPSAAVLGEERRGTAVAVGPHQALTAHYLVLGARAMSVVDREGRSRHVRSKAIHHESGLALLQLEGSELPAVRFGSAAAPGLPVFLLASDGAGEQKGATGHITTIGPFEAFWEYMLDYAIMTTAVNPGLAGAPLFDPQGRVIGIVSLGLAAVGRYSLAIPIDLFLRNRPVLESGQPPDSPHAWVGFYPQVQDEAVVLTGIVPGGPADRAGLERGDVVLSIDGKPVSTLRELYSELWSHSPGDDFRLHVLRDGELRLQQVVAGNRYEFYA